MATVYGSLASTPSTFCHNCLPGVASLPQRVSEATTSADVISLPLWNFTPRRSLNVYVRPRVADGVALDEQRDRAVVLVVGVERLVDVPGDLLHDHGGGRVQVERRRLADHRRLEHAAGLGLLLSAERPDGRQGERDGQYENTSGETTHGGLLVLRRYFST